MRVGFMGSARMRSYTLLGDNVNFGSRLEGTHSPRRSLAITRVPTSNTLSPYAQRDSFSLAVVYAAGFVHAGLSAE